MDFDDLLLQTNLLFRDHPGELDKYREAFDYLLVDEYQDTNYSQYLIVKKLSEIHRNLCVVGDDAQSIYSFRGARIENILNFKNDYPDYRLFKLEQNYRSTQTIVNAANSIIKKNRGQISKEVFSKNENGDPVRVLKAADDREEGFLVAGHISDLRFREQLEHKDFAILYRTNAQSRIFEESLRRMNIPYKVYGSLSFYQRKEIKDLLAYFRITVNPRDDESLKRIINYPMRGIGKTTLDKLNAYAEKLDTPIWEVLTHLDQVNLGFNKGTLTRLHNFTAMIRSFRKRLPEMVAFDLAYTIALEAGIIKELQADKTPENVSRFENIEQLLNGIKDFTDDPDREGEMNLGDYLQEVTLMTDMDQEKEEDRNRVTIMTIHSSKGLEFKHLVIAGVEEELFPSQMSLDNPKDLEEERRLFYVALTRAEKSALITYSAQRMKWGIVNACSPSRFIKEIDPRYLELPPDFYPSVPASEEVAHGRFQETGRGQFRAAAGGRRLQQVRPSVRSPQASGASSQLPKDFIPSDPGMIRVGSRVEHPRFGTGEVQDLEGTGSNMKATVLFPIGTKQLLLKFAKLRVVD
jgi:DNA helicase-2/ATP-dependent DNA helicase PcrA